MHYAAASLLEALEGERFGCIFFISFHEGILKIFDSVPESNKKSISRSGD